MPHKRHSQGFTLIELLVVIAIIAILAAILFPVFAQAREAARTTSCASNEKQITLGLLQYVQDYDERFPIYQYALTPGDSTYGKTDPFGGTYLDYQRGWDEACQPYIKNKQLLWCPSAATPGNDYTNNTKHDSDWTGSLNYATNCRLTGKYGATAKLAVLSYPAQTILLSENGAQGSEGACRIENDEWGWTNSQTNALISDAGSGAKPGPLVRHKGGSNYAFSDGHAKWYSGKSLGLQSDGTANDTQVGKIMDDSGNNPTYHLAVGN